MVRVHAGEPPFISEHFQISCTNGVRMLKICGRITEAFAVACPVEHGFVSFGHGACSRGRRSAAPQALTQEPAKTRVELVRGQRRLSGERYFQTTVALGDGIQAEKA